MELRHDFVKLLSQNIREKEKRDTAYMKQFNKVKVSSNRSLLSDTQQQYQNGREKSLFDLLSSRYGVDEFYSILQHKFRYVWQQTQMKADIGEPLRTLQQVDGGDEQTPPEAQVIEFDEHRLLIFMREVFADVPEHRVYDLFDLQIFGREKMGLKEVFLVVAYAAAVESRQVLEYIHLYGQLLFSIAAGGPGTEKITGARLKILAKCLGVPERKTASTLRDINIAIDEECPYEDFELFLFALFQEQPVAPYIAQHALSIPTSPTRMQQHQNTNFMHQNKRLTAQETAKTTGCTIY